jgi:hypothetical protein
MATAGDVSEENTGQYSTCRHRTTTARSENHGNVKSQLTPTGLLMEGFISVCDNGLGSSVPVKADLGTAVLGALPRTLF